MRTYDAPGPNRAYVVSLDLSHTEYKVRMGFPEHKRNYSVKETTSRICSRYDQPPAHDVLAAINASRFNWSGPGITGMLADSGNYIQAYSISRETYIFTDARWSEIEASVGSTGFTITCPNGTIIKNAGADLPQVDNAVRIYTPDYDSSTHTTIQGTEVILTDVSYPMRPNKTVTGIVSAVKTGAESVNNAIPAGGMVISASGDKASVLASNVAVGDRVAVKGDISVPSFNNAQLMLTGAGWIVKDGAPNTSTWSNYPKGDTDRQPRTAIAYNATTLFFVVVDGRQAPASVGHELRGTREFPDEHAARHGRNRAR